MTTTATDLDRCGTYAGAQAHGKASTEVCAACRIARRDYMRDLRAKSAHVRAEDAAYRAARYRATVRLIELHPSQWQILLDDERSRA